MLNERHTNALRDGLIEKMRHAGIDVNTDWQEGERVLQQHNGSVHEMSKGQKRALETVVPGDGSPFKATAVSSVDGAKVLNNSETNKDLAKKALLPSSRRTRT